MSLTPQQQQVVDWQTGPVLVSAGAGAGKTKCLIERYSRLLKSGVTPESVLAITFTNKAANEMKERASKVVDIDPKKMHIFTFHGLCNFWLRKKGSLVGIPSYQLLGPNDQTTMLKSSAMVFDVLGRPITQRSSDTSGTKLEKFILRMFKYMDVTPNATIEDAIDYAEGPAAYCKSVYLHYIEEKKKQSKLDFADLQQYGIDMFSHPDFPHNYEYVFQDESQDMNDMNFDLIKVLARNKNIMAVADTKQCIYKFRGSNPTVVNRFITEFGAHELFLTKNFRSNTSIVDIANDTVVRQEEKMQSNSTDKGSVIYYEFQTHVEELQWLAKSIKNIVKP